MASEHHSPPSGSLGPWTLDDAPAGLSIFGREEVTHWLTPAMEPIHDEAGMLAALERWAEEDAEADPPVGHWAVRRGEDDAWWGRSPCDGCRRSRRISSSPGSSPQPLGQRLRDRGCTSGGCLGVRGIGTRAVRGDATRQRASGEARAAAGHAVGRRDQQVLRPAAPGVSAAAPGPCRRHQSVAGDSAVTASITGATMAAWRVNLRSPSPDLVAVERQHGEAGSLLDQDLSLRVTRTAGPWPPRLSGVSESVPRSGPR